MGELEEKSLWYYYKSQVWYKESEQSKIIHNSMRILRSIKNDKELLYASVPITSGKHYYELLLQNPKRNKEEIRDISISDNYNEGWKFVQGIIKRTDKPVLYPADMIPTHNNWEQPHFQALWLSIIGEKCSEVHMQKGWEYSNGSSEEFTHTYQLRLGLPRCTENLIFYNTKESEEYARERLRNMNVFDHTGKIISAEEGYNKMGTAIKWIKESGFNPSKIENSRNLLEWTIDKLEGRFYQ